MKKKLLEQKEKTIIESFAKTFNKIKRIDENEINEVLDVTQHLKVGDRLEKINTASPDTLTIVKIDGNKLFIKADKADQTFQWTLDSVDDEIKRGKLKWFPKNEAIDEMNISEISKYAQTGILIINLRSASDAMRVKNLLDSQGFDGEGDDAVFAVTYGNGWWEDIEQEKNGNFGVLFSVLNVEEAKKIVNMIFTSDSKSPFYELNRYDYEIVNFKIGQYGTKTWEPIEGAKELDEISIPKVLAPVAFAAGMMGAPKDSAAQAITSQGGHQISYSDTTTSLPDNDYKAGKVILNSYNKNPFTADMWSKQSGENKRFFKTIKKLADYRDGGGQIEDSDLSHLGAEARRSNVATDFLQRKDNKTARLEEDDDMGYYEMDEPKEKIHAVKVLESVKDFVTGSLNFYKEKYKSDSKNEFIRGAIFEAESAIRSIDNHIEDVEQGRF